MRVRSSLSLPSALSLVLMVFGCSCSTGSNGSSGDQSSATVQRDYAVASFLSQVDERGRSPELLMKSMEVTTALSDAPSTVDGVFSAVSAKRAVLQALSEQSLKAATELQALELPGALAEDVSAQLREYRDALAEVCKNEAQAYKALAGATKATVAAELERYIEATKKTDEARSAAGRLSSALMSPSSTPK